MGLKRRRDSAPLIMRDQYVATLNALGMDAFGRPSDGHRQLSEIKKSVESLLRNDPTWVQVFEAEQLLLEIIPDTTVNAELESGYSRGRPYPLSRSNTFERLQRTRSLQKRSARSSPRPFANFKNFL
ncbi:hypothetical protein CDO25_19260 (plasmid) [Sinorhizobium meliloti]|nr:hypothetical protein CDO25_19260 [Sinorhizobium meliloti]